MEETFRAFCAASRGLEGRNFAKLCRDCQLFDKRFSVTDADLIFAKVVAGGGQRRMDFHQFELALRAAAEKKGVEASSVLQAVSQMRGGPSVQGTKAEAVRLHDEFKSTLTTGLQPPRATPSPVISGRSERVCTDSGRLEADAVSFHEDLKSVGSAGLQPPRPLPTPVSSGRSEKAFVDSGRLEAPLSPPTRSRGSSDGIAPSGGSVEQTFRAFCGSRQDMDGRSFTKLCRDCRLIGRGFSASEADIVFAAVSRSRRMDLPRFEEALRLIADRKGLDNAAVRRAVASSCGPTLHCTKTDPVRFYDERCH